MTGITIRDAAARTGLSERQLRLMIERQTIRFERLGEMPGGPIRLHPVDVDRLEHRRWLGREVPEDGVARTTA